MPLLTIIVPCYRNAVNLPATFDGLLGMERELPAGTAVEYVFVDDGSDDGTFAKLVAIQGAHRESAAVIKLTRNTGIYNALLAGFAEARGECVTVFPADMQE